MQVPNILSQLDGKSRSGMLKKATMPRTSQASSGLIGTIRSDVTAFAKLSVKGSDATKFMDYMVANKLPKVSAVMFMNSV